MDNPQSYRVSGAPFPLYFEGPTVQKTGNSGRAHIIRPALTGDEEQQLRERWEAYSGAWAHALRMACKLVKPGITSGVAPAHDAFEGSVSV